MSLRRAFIGCQIIETAENYVRADEPLFTKPETESFDERYWDRVYDDGEFWKNVLDYPERVRTQTFRLEAVLSEWVARVPGLYWTPGSKQLRQITPEAIEYRNGNWVTYTPLGKSQKVIGGIGTLRLPPGRDGYRLATLTMSLNASAGIPTLISPEVWERHELSEGSVLDVRGCHWRAMDSEWSSNFPITKGIPRGYIILDESIEIEVRERGAPALVHPFTIMEYRRGPTELFDYVFASADTTDPRYRKRVERFFDSYKDRKNRHGEYLLAGDIVDPLWEAKFNSPEDLRRADPSADSQLSILEARVRERHLGEHTIEDFLEALSSACDTVDDLKTLSDEIEIPPAIWFRGGSVAEASNQLLEEARRQKKLEALIVRLGIKYPNLVKAR